MYYLSSKKDVQNYCFFFIYPNFFAQLYTLDTIPCFFLPLEGTLIFLWSNDRLRRMLHAQCCLSWCKLSPLPLTSKL